MLEVNVPLDILLQEPGLVILENALAEKPEVGRRETSPRNARDHVHLVQEPALFPVEGDFRCPQFLEHSIRKGGRPGAAAGERQDEQQLFRIALRPHVLGDVPVAGSELLQRRVDRVVPEVAAARRRREKQKKAYRCQDLFVGHVRVIPCCSPWSRQMFFQELWLKRSLNDRLDSWISAHARADRSHVPSQLCPETR